MWHNTCLLCLGHLNDSIGEVVKQIRPATNADPQGEITSYSYNPVGNVIKTTEPSGVFVTNSYTPQNQLASTTYSDSTPSINYSYDPSGLMTKMTDASGTSSYTYDPFGEVTSVTNGQGQTIRYTYDSLGDQTSISYPLPSASDAWSTSALVSYGYGNAGNITDVSDFTGGATATAYNQDGLPTTTNFPLSGTQNGTISAPSITSSYDLADEISAITASNSQGTILGFGYTRSPAGTIAAEATMQGTAHSSATYNYDTLSRVTGMTQVLASTAGSGMSSNSSYNYDPSSNLMLLPGGASASYDLAGELISSNISATNQPAAETTYSYNANGDRIASEVSQGSGSPVVQSSAEVDQASEAEGRG